MKKILSTFLLSAMLVLVLGGCESSGLESRVDAQHTLNLKQQNEIDKLERRVESLSLEIIWLHGCVGGASVVDKDIPSLVLGCGGTYKNKSPYRSVDAFREWEKKDYYPSIPGS
ncbi:hypothetical protein FIM04_04890 [SAR202 cluster bacterium AC-409-J13_OGT_754m]|nr:hypothetical protein [SAR202 cluster bacterium AC-409-J13_OGT_754m]